MPIGYDAYNVPYPYRDYYYDTDDAYYRYGDGGIFQVDPATGMIEAIVALLAGDLNIGQPLPTGYDAYNLPRSEEHTSELQSLMRISYAVFCLNKKLFTFFFFLFSFFLFYYFFSFF